MIVERGLSVPMRDGVVLRADVYRSDNGRPGPALVLRTPYDRSVALIPSSGIEPESAVAAGFALVCQDVRGMHESDGEFYTFVHEGPDGYDSVEWVAAQPWCDGSVGMVGRSYAATCQWLAASERPPHLKGICPVVTGSDFYRGWVYQGGAFQLGLNLFWTSMMSDRRGATKAGDLFDHLPLRTVQLPDPKWGRFYFDWLDHPTDDEYWARLSVNRRYGQIEVPALNVGGWFDIFLGGTLENFSRMRREGGSEAARAGQRLLVGPWAHGSTYGLFPDHSFDVFAPTRLGRLRRRPAALLRGAPGRRRGRRPAAGADLRHGREPLARRGRLAARPGAADAVVPARGRRFGAGGTGHRGSGRVRLRPK